MCGGGGIPTPKKCNAIILNGFTVLFVLRITKHTTRDEYYKGEPTKGISNAENRFSVGGLHLSEPLPGLCP